MPEEEFSLPVLVGNLVSAYKQHKINDIDLYNSILRLVYYSEEGDREKLKEIISWLGEHERKGTPPEVQYDYKRVKNGVGDEYLGGLERIARGG